MTNVFGGFSAKFLAKLADQFDFFLSSLSFPEFSWMPWYKYIL